MWVEAPESTIHFDNMSFWPVKISALNSRIMSSSAFATATFAERSPLPESFLSPDFPSFAA